VYQQLAENSSLFCPVPAPQLSGLIGPFASAAEAAAAGSGTDAVAATGSGTEVAAATERAASEPSGLAVRLGGHAFYHCAGGKVLNARTNARVATIPCSAATNSFSISELPDCVPAELCVGPVAQAVQGALASPRRDAKVNTKVELFCGQGKKVAGSCFPDGFVRFPGGLDACDVNEANETRLGHIISSCDTDGAKVIYLHNLDDFGWIVFGQEEDKAESAAAAAVPEAPSLLDLINQRNESSETSDPLSNVVNSLFLGAFLSAASESGRPLLLPATGGQKDMQSKEVSVCRYLLDAPEGYAIRVGVEEAPSLSGSGSGSLKLADGDGGGGRMVRAGATVASTGSRVLAEARLRPGQRFKINFQVVEP